MRYRNIVYAPNLTQSDIIEEIKDDFSIDERDWKLDRSGDVIYVHKSKVQPKSAVDS